MPSATTIYLNAIGSLERSLAAIAREPAVARETSYYLAQIGDVTSIDDFLAERRLVNYAMTAHGLGDMAYATAFVRKLLEGGVDDRNALANRLLEARYAAFVSIFNFARHGTSTTAFGHAQQGTVELYMHVALETSVGDESEDARLALYFRRKAPGVSTSLDILADAQLLKVTRTVLGLTSYMSNLRIDAQRRMIDGRLTVADLRDPQKLETFIGCFTAKCDAQRDFSRATAILPILKLPKPALGTNPLSVIQNLKLR